MIQSMSRVLGVRRLLSEDMYHPAHVIRSLIRRYHGRGRWRAF
jgi:hypothetical protein